jgi:hypothetical protein
MKSKDKKPSKDTNQTAKYVADTLIDRLNKRIDEEQKNGHKKPIKTTT